MCDTDYSVFSEESLAKFDRAEVAIAKAKLLGAEIPSSLTNALNLAKTQYEEVEKKFLCGNKGEAIRDMQKVNRSAYAVSETAEELYFKACSQKVCEVHNSYRDHKDLATKYIPNYNIHKKNLRDIKKRRESNEIPQWEQACSDNDQLQSFLDDFELGKEELSFAIEEKEEEKREREEAKKEATKRFHISTRLTCVVIIIAVATLIVSSVGPKGCGDSSLQPAQSET